MNEETKSKAVNLEDLQSGSKQVLNKGFGNVGTCSTAAATAAKAVTLGTTFNLVEGATIVVTFTNGISVANSTLAVTHTPIGGSSTTETAKPIYYRGAALPANIVKANDRLILRYNGTQFDVVGALGLAESEVDEKISAAVNVEKTRAEGVEEALDGRIDTLEDAVGTGGSVDSRISAAVATESTRAQAAESSLSSGKADKATTLSGYGITDAYTKSETYTKTEVNGLVDTPHQEYVTVDAYANLPAQGSADTIYRVSNYNGSTSQVDETVYSEYAWNGSSYTFLCVKSQIGEVFDISVYNNNAKYADLAAALNGGANIPQSLQKGGMSIKFVQSSDNKYVQYRLMSTAWSISTSDWQGVDDEPTAGSENLVKSGGVFTPSNALVSSKIPINGKVSIIGDSVSTFAGTMPSGYETYYPNAGRGVTSQYEMWWDMILSESNSQLEVNASWSGSRATKTNGDVPDFYDRTNILGSPDYIFVALGTNDSRYNISLGEYDYDSSIAELSEQTFREAYIKGIKSLLTNYPSANIILVIMAMNEPYKQSIVSIGEHFDLDVIDCSSYYVDNVHPNSYGMKTITRLINNYYSMNGLDAEPTVYSNRSLNSNQLLNAFRKEGIENALINNGIGNYKLINGWYSNGVIEYRTTEFLVIIPVNDVSILELSPAKNSSYSRFGFFENIEYNKNYPFSVTFATGESDMRNIPTARTSFNIPSNTKYIIFTVYNNNASGQNLLSDEVILDGVNLQNSVLENINQLRNIVKVKNSTVFNSYFDANNGVSYSDNWRSLLFLNNKNYTKIVFNPNCVINDNLGINYGAVLFYKNTVPKAVSDLISKKTFSQIKTNTLNEIDIPEGTKAIVVSSRTTNADDIYVSLVNEGNKGNYTDYIDTSITFQQGSINNTGSVVSRTDRLVSSFVCVDEINYAKVSKDYVLFMACYDRNKKYLSNTSASLNIIFDTNKIPENCKFVRFIIAKNSSNYPTMSAGSETIEVSDSTGFELCINKNIRSLVEYINNVEGNDIIDITSFYNKTETYYCKPSGQLASSPRWTALYYKAELIKELLVTLNNSVDDTYKAICFYNTDNVWFESLPNSSVSFAELKINPVVSIPEGCKTVVLFNRNDDGDALIKCRTNLQEVFKLKKSVDDLCATKIDSIGVPEFYLNGPTTNYSDMTWVGNKLVGFSSQSGNSQDYNSEDAANIFIWIFGDGIKERYTEYYTLKHKFGHCNTVDYCPENDCLILGNGSGSYTLEGDIIIIPNFSSVVNVSATSNTPLTLEDVNALIIHCADYNLGTKFNVMWGEDNDGHYDIAYLITANMGGTITYNGGDLETIRRIKLCKDDEVGSYGEVVENDTPFNGTFEIINTYHQTTQGYDDCIQGGCYYMSEIKAAIGHGKYRYWSMCLSDGKVYRKDYNQIQNYTKPTTYYGCGEGVCVKDGYMFIGKVGIGIAALRV